MIETAPYKVISATASPSNSLFAPDASALPALDIEQFNLAVTSFELPPLAQTYFDGLDLCAVAQNAPSGKPRTLWTPWAVILFAVDYDAFNEFADHAKRNLPDHPLREHFIAAMLEVADWQRKMLGKGTAIEIRINMEDAFEPTPPDSTPSRLNLLARWRRFWRPDTDPKQRRHAYRLHEDPYSSWRSLWQPQHSQLPAPTTIIADDDVYIQEKDRIRKKLDVRIEEVNPELLWSAPPSALIFLSGDELPRPRVHAESRVRPGMRPRFVMLASP